jgi:hypothetical protein
MTLKPKKIGTCSFGAHYVDVFSRAEARMKQWITDDLIVSDLDTGVVISSIVLLGVTVLALSQVVPDTASGAAFRERQRVLTPCEQVGGPLRREPREELSSPACNREIEGCSTVN